jgi:hypothetical protein
MTTVYPLPPPYGLKLKLRRARQHLRQMRRTLEAFAASNPGRWVFEPNAEGTHYACRLEPPDGPDMLQIWADEAAHHLRNVLDHLFVALIEANKGKVEGRNYPIRLGPPSPADEAAWQAALKGLPPYARALIVKNQPYKRGDAAKTHPLWILSRLDNKFKHASVHLLAFQSVTPDLPGMIRPPRKSLLQARDVVCYVPIDTDLDKDFMPYSGMAIGFKTEFTGVQAEITILEEIYDFVRDEIVGKCISLRKTKPLRQS